MTRSIEATLFRELDAARGRVEALAVRRQHLQQELAAAAATEEAERRSLRALEAIARGADGEAATEVGDSGIDQRLLAGTTLRTMIVRVALRGGRAGSPAHWRDWYDWLREAGFEAAGKKPEATFLTQLARSPMVARGPQDGVYVLDLARFVEAQRELQELHERLTRLPPPDQLSMLGELRAQRQSLQTAIGRCERALHEMWQVLVDEVPDGWPANVEPSPDRIVAWWMHRGDTRQECLRA